MEDEERQKKLEAGKAKLAEYRQRKAHTESQKKQKKKKKKKPAEDLVEDEPDHSAGGEEVSGGERHGSRAATKDPPTTEFTFTRTLQSGETVKHDQTYTIEPESEVSTTAEDYSSEEEVDHLRQGTKEGTIQDMEDALAAKNQVVEDLRQELEEFRAAFGTEGIQQLQDFEAALKQRDGIITQLTSNLQQARDEKDEIMKEFLELTEQSQKLQIQFQQLQAGETLRNTSHSSTAADLLQAKQQLIQYQQQLEEMNVEIRKHQERNSEQVEQISQLQHNLSEMEMTRRGSEESCTQRINEKDLLIAEQEKIITRQEQSQAELKMAESSFQQTLEEKHKLIAEQTAIISKHEQSLTLLREELVRVGRTAEENIVHKSGEKDQIIAEQERVISERDCCITQLQDELESSEKRLRDLHQRMAAGELELERCLDELESLKCDLNSSKSETESCKLELEKEQKELEIYKSELANSKQKERMSSNEIMQLMGTVEELQKRYHQGALSEGDVIQKMQEETGKKLELLRAELDEMYGQQIVQMKQELNLQHAAKVEEMATRHQTELELIKAHHPSHTSTLSTIQVETLNVKIKELQVTLEQSQEAHDETRHELSQVSREKFSLQAKVEDLLRDLHSAEEKMELASRNLISQESHQEDLQHLQDTISSLQCQLAAAHESTQEAEAKHESEVTNYKIKLEMLEREKDAVLGRMAESQEAELERLRTQLLFSHEEELTVLREDLQRENCLNAENLLQEAAIKHERALNELRVGYEEKLNLLQGEKASAATERDELLRQIQGLKEDLDRALHDSKADEPIQQLQELQLELEELRKEEIKRAEIENEIQTLRLKDEARQNAAKEREQCWQNKLKEWELEKASLVESTNVLKEELGSKNTEVETLEAKRKELQQQIVDLCDETEKQRTTFSFAEKNFEVNYQELKGEYTCLIAAKTQLEEKTLKETLEFEAKIASLQSQIQELDESRTGSKVDETYAFDEKDTTELMEKLHVTVGEKQSLAAKLSEVAEQLMFAENKVGQLEEELSTLRRDNKKVIAQNESPGKELDEEHEIMSERRRGQAAQRKTKLHQEKQPVEPGASVCSVEDHHLQIRSLQGEVEALQSLLRAAEAERDSIRQTLELQRLRQTPSPAAVQPPGEGPVEGLSSPQKSSGSSRRKRRQRWKQERKLVGTNRADSREERQREEEEEEDEEALVEEETATSAAEPEMQSRIQTQVLSCSQERAGREDSADGYQGDGSREYINRQMRSHTASCHTETGAEEETTEHGECRLQMEAQRLSLSQIHAARLELLQEGTDCRTQSPELKQDRDQDVPKLFKYQSLLQAVSEESGAIVLSLQKVLGEELSENVDSASWQLASVETPEMSESNSVVLSARDLYRDLQQVNERIEQEYNRLLQLQSALRADGNKMTKLQTLYNELKSSSEKEIAELRVQVASLSPSTSKDPEDPTAAPSPCLSVHLQRLKAEAQEKQLQLEESHRQELDRLRAYYQQQATETQQRYTTELCMLEQQLQEVTATESHTRLTESTSERMEAQSEEQKELSEEELLKGGAALRRPARAVGLSAQLQALRKALYNKYTQEVATLKEQHSGELRRLREEREQERKGGECRHEAGEEAEAAKVEYDSDSFSRSGCSTESLGPTGQVRLEEKQHWENVEEEVAKVIVQMSVQFAQQTEFARLSRRACQTSTSVQTECDEEEADEAAKEERTPRASLTAGVWMEEAEKEALERELEERNAEIEKLKEELQEAESRPRQALKCSEAGQQQGEEEEEEEDPGGLGSRQAGQPRPSSQDDGESADKDTLTAERNLHKANEKLCQVLLDVLKTTAAAEETMGLHMQSLRDASGGHQQAASPQSTWQRVNTEPVRAHAAESCHSSQTVADDVSVWSGETDADEGLEMSQQVMVVGSQLENEEYLMSISSRLQTALEKMLTTITDTTNQLEHARVTQTELMRESFRRNQEISDLLQKQEELQERVLEEARAREHLAHELQRAEGLIDGYTGERAVLEEHLRQKDELQMSLEQELQVTSCRLHELEQERLQMQQERELLARQQDAMKEHAAPRELRLVEAAMVAAPEADLLEETEKLMKEKVEVQRQAEKESMDLLKQVKLLEAELEEQVNRVIELEHAQKTEGGDLRQQIQALEKQLEKNRRFLDEQAVDREHERDFFQQEIQKLEQQLKSPQKLQTGSEKRHHEVDGVAVKVEQLTAQLKEKADWCSELLLSSEQLRRELGERDEEIDKLESRIRELEQALLASAESLEKVEQKKQHASLTDARHSTLEAQLQTEREALERKEKEISNLEEQLEQFREELENKSEEVQLLHMQLEIQRKEQQQHLETRDGMIQVMEDKDREIALLNEQITKLQHMETASDNKEIDARDELIKELESQVECMRSEQERLKMNNVEELDQLNAVIDKLQQELANIEQKQTTEEDEEAKSRASGPSKEEYDEMKQKMDLATEELDALQTEHRELFETHQRLQESSAALTETEKPEGSECELEEVLREKTARLVVLQAQVHALEQSATSRVEELTLRIQDLEGLVGEKDRELAHCRLLVEQKQSHADGLQQKVSNLEENLGERMAAAIVSQATLEAFQHQRSKGSKEEPQKPAESQGFDFGSLSIPQLDFSKMGQARQAPAGKVVHLTQKLRELEVGLSGMQKDQELQKQLLSSSEEDVMAYERRLAVLMDLLSQMKTKTAQRRSPPVESSSADGQPPVLELLQELQEVRDEASATKEQLSSYKESCGKLQEELKEKTVTMEQLKDQLQRVSSGSSEGAEMSELQKELAKAQNEAAATKEELNSFRESCEKLQELLQEREMTIARLKDELNQQVTAEDDGASMMELLQELQELRKDSSSTKEELRSSKQHIERLENDVQGREVSICELREELEEVRKTLDTTKEELNGSRQHVDQLKEDLQGREVSICQQREELEEVRKTLDTTKEELSSSRQHVEQLQEDLQGREVSICKQREELEEVRKTLDTTKEELSSSRQHVEQLQEDLQGREVSICKQREELEEVRKTLDTTKEELSSSRQHVEQLQEDLQGREVSICKQREELEEIRKTLDTTKELSSSRQHVEQLQEDLQGRVVSICKQREELEEVRKTLDTTKEELSSSRQHVEQLQEDLQGREVSICQQREELEDVRKMLDTTKEELRSSKQHVEQLQEDLQGREVSICQQREELEDVRKMLDTTKEELRSSKQHVEQLQEDLQGREVSICKQREELEEVRKTLDTTKEELNGSRQHVEQLQEDLRVREVSICKQREELEDVRKMLDTTKEELRSSKQHVEQLQEDLRVREVSICKQREELEEVRKTLDTTKEELNGSRQHVEQLQEDLQGREVSICKQREELEEVRKTLGATKELSSSKQHIEKLEDDLRVREVSICKQREELDEVGKAMDAIKEELCSSRQRIEQLQEDLQVREVSLSNLKEELQEVRKNRDTTKEELNISRQQNENLQNDLQVREVSISKLKEELQEARTPLTKAADLASKSPSPAPSPQLHSSASSTSTTQPKRKGGKQPTVKGSSAKDKPSVSRKVSSSSSQSSNKTQSPRPNGCSERHRVAVTDSFTQTDPVQTSDLGPDSKSASAATKEELDEVIGEFQEKIVQMQELHAAEILDMEARHISESEILRRDTQALEDECKALKAIIDKLRSGEAPLSRQDRPTSLFKDGYTSDSSSDYSQRTGYDLPSLQQEFRTTPEGARREPDDPLPDQIKTLLREVHQEGMQVLSLSELPLSEGEPTSQLHIQGWAKERRDLLASVEALKDLIAQMKRRGETQASGAGDWREELLDAVRLVFVRERSVLKNALYSQLDLLDTSDAIIHLNHLERRLAEQDAVHRESMSALHTAERSSLVSEIQQLRDQLQQLHQGAQPVASVPGESSVKEQREGGGGGAAAEASRLLVEELKCELSQTKLELETTLKAQHKHLKELDTLRTEVSLKAAEVDALNDQLSEDKKRIRELQWTVEKERCRTGRSEESKREELEDLHLTLEEQKSRVAQLTSALERERQASSQLTQQADQERLNLRRHLQELQVQLETERAKAQETSAALGRERELRTCQEQVEEDGDGLKEEGSLLERLQRELDDKHAQVVHLLGQLEAQRLEVIRKEAELTLVSQGSRRDQEALLEARTQLENLEARLSEAQEQLEKELERSRRLEEEKERLEERLVHLEGQRGGGGGDDEGGALQSDHRSAAWRSDPTDRTKDWVFQQKSRNDEPASSSMATQLEVTQPGHIGGPGQGHYRTVDKVLGKLRLISSKIHDITSKTPPGCLTTEVDSEDLSWVQSGIDEVITMLQQSQSVPCVPESASLLAGGSSHSLTERLLRQNAELTGFVSRLTEEKNDLRNHTLRLEEELRRYRQAGSGRSASSRRGTLTADSAGLLLSQEREAWTRERAFLEKSLHAAQAQAARLRAELRTSMLREITGPEADNAALKRMYGKYLRSESFRKALIYQKKYLLLLLGGFQECEEATLSLLCRMGGRPSLTAIDSVSHRRRALTRFRSAVRVSIALSRMRFLVKRWQRATGATSVTSGGVSKNAAAQTMGTDVRDSSYLHPGSVEVYRERGGGVSSSRGRSGRESPRSASSPHHRFHAAGDPGALTCSHLQSYDPDRALTDYISRLEALQRRLGSVTSGASSYAHLHFGLRR